jgi:hypothetical protein
MSFDTPLTEAQCLATRIATSASNTVEDLDWYAMAVGHGVIRDKNIEGYVEHTSAALARGRAQQFDAARLATLVNSQTQALRRLFSLSTYVVDQLRFLAAQMQVPANEDFVCMATLGDMQEQIKALFPGEEFPGD